MSASTTNTTLPTPNDRKALRFHTDKPESLPQFWEQMMDYFTKDRITDTNKHMKTIIKYTQPEVDHQWPCFDIYKQGGWDTFKKEVFSNYLQAQEINQGSLEWLEKVCLTSETSIMLKY